MFGFNKKSWSEEYCEAIEQNLKENAAIAMALNQTETELLLVLNGKNIQPKERLQAFQVGFVLGEMSKFGDDENQDPTNRMKHLWTTIAYWKLKIGKISTQSEADNISNIYNDAAHNKSYTEERQLGYDFAISDYDINLITTYFNNNEESISEDFLFGIELCKNIYKSHIMKGETIWISQITELALEKNPDGVGDVINGFISQMKHYLGADEVIGLKSSTDEDLGYIHREYYKGK